MVETCEFFRTIIAGCEVHIHTDHLNNTVLAQALSHPDKILRMLLKVEHLVKPRWIFAPGQAQFGDGLSRNPPDRGVTRGHAEDKAHLPKTLAEVFEEVSNLRIVSSDLVDDSAAIAQARL